MNASVTSDRQPEHFDVLIVGAGDFRRWRGLSSDQAEPRNDVCGAGGAGLVWRHLVDAPLSRHPAQDSDLYTFGYRFKPWVGTPIATGAEILKYMGEVIEENDLGRHIRYRHKVLSAEWSSAEAQWTVLVERGDTGERLTLTAGFLWMCQGYYQHQQGYTPDWPGLADFKGRVIHPQTWPEDAGLKDKKVVVIGSGATAATLIPAIADAAEHVTMLQRSPTYFVPGRNVDDMANQLRDLEIPEEWIHEIVRRQRLKMGQLFTQMALAYPDGAKQQLLAGVSAIIGEKLTEKHFTPSYRPWRQRIAVVPDGDLVQKIKAGKARA